MMEGKPGCEQILEILEESRRIPCEYFANNLLDITDEDSQLPWGRLQKERIPAAYRIQDVHLEQAVEAIYQVGQIGIDELDQFRQNTLQENLEYLMSDFPVRETDFPLDNPEEVARNARLYRKSMELCEGIEERDIPEGRVLQNLEYVEILAEKIARRFPGIPMSAEYSRELLGSVVDVYAKFFNESMDGKRITQGEFREKVARARNEITMLYPIVEAEDELNSSY